MKTSELIRALTQMLILHGDLNVLVECDVLSTILDIEMRQKPHFDEPILVIMADGSETPAGRNGDY